MNLQDRILTLVELGKILNDPEIGTATVAEKAHRENAWFTPAFTSLSTKNIVGMMLQPEALSSFVEQYRIPEAMHPKTVGIVMAGNIPMVGFHDLLMVLLSGHKVAVKLSSKDNVLMPFVLKKIHDISPELGNYITVKEQLKDCDAYIATGSNNSGRYFEYYFAKYPHIIRRNRTSVAILNGTESLAELEGLASDMLTYFGLGCRNVTAIRVPEGYHWEPLLASLNAFAWMKDHNKFRNNYDYQLSLHILNNQYYMSDGNVLFVENPSLFAPISTIHYQYYTGNFDWENFATDHAQDLQCIVGHETGVSFGTTQVPALSDFADGVDTMSFLLNL